MQAAQAVAGAEVTVGAGGVLVGLVVALLLPDSRWKPLYTGSAFRRMQADRDFWRKKALAKD